MKRHRFKFCKEYFVHDEIFTFHGSILFFLSLSKETGNYFRSAGGRVGGRDTHSNTLSDRHQEDFPSLVLYKSTDSPRSPL